MLSFETITLAPIERRLIDGSLLDETERNSLNTYHARVRDTLAPKLDSRDRRWLESATASIR
jgi:Xaa-Pro aminopeptidase